MKTYRETGKWRPSSDPQTSLFDRFLLEVGEYGDFHHPLIRKQALRGAYTVRRWGRVNAKTRFAW